MKKHRPATPQASWAALFAMLLLSTSLFILSSCGKEGRCKVPIGDASCQLDPHSPLYPGINNCDGYEYLVAVGFGYIVLECPKGHSRFNTFADGCPLEGSRTSCYLYKYSTYYDGTTLFISNY